MSHKIKLIPNEITDFLDYNPNSGILTWINITGKRAKVGDAEIKYFGEFRFNKTGGKS